MTLEEQLEQIAGTAAERQLIRRWLRQPPGASGGAAERPAHATIAAQTSTEPHDGEDQSPPVVAGAG